MILPTKHMRPRRTLLGVGARILATLNSPMTVSALWDRIRVLDESTNQAAITYRWFVLSLDLLYIAGAVEFHQGAIRKAS